MSAPVHPDFSFSQSPLTSHPRSQPSRRTEGDGDGGCAGGHDWQNIGYDKDRQETLRACNRQGCQAKEIVRWDDRQQTPASQSAALLFELAPDLRRARKVAFARTRVVAALSS